MKSLITDPDLADLIDNAEVADLCTLTDYITDKGKGRSALSGESCKTLVDAKEASYFDPKSRALLVEEIKRYGGHSIMNILRGGEGVAFREMAGDVARHMGIKTSKDQDCVTVEMLIIMKMFEQSFKEMSEEQREEAFKEFGGTYTRGTGPAAFAALQILIRQAGFGAYKVALIVVNAVAKAMLGRGLALAGNAVLVRGLSLFSGPVGWALTAGWALYDLGSPAYRVTVPCVLHIAYMRQKEAARMCPKCGTQVRPTDKFCASCGTVISPQIPQDKPLN